MQSRISFAKISLDMAKKYDPDFSQVEQELVQSGQLSEADFRSALQILYNDQGGARKQISERRLRS